MSGHSFATAANAHPITEPLVTAAGAHPITQPLAIDAGAHSITKPLAALHRKLCTARRVALRSGVLKRCTVHHQVFYDDQDPRPAFELMLDMFKDNDPAVSEYGPFKHELLDVLSQVIAEALPYCAECRAGLMAGWELQDVGAR